MDSYSKYSSIFDKQSRTNTETPQDRFNRLATTGDYYEIDNSTGQLAEYAPLDSSQTMEIGSTAPMTLPFLESTYGSDLEALHYAFPQYPFSGPWPPPRDNSPLTTRKRHLTPERLTLGDDTSTIRQAPSTMPQPANALSMPYNPASGANTASIAASSPRRAPRETQQATSHGYGHLPSTTTRASAPNDRKSVTPDDDEDGSTTTQTPNAAKAKGLLVKHRPPFNARPPLGYAITAAELNTFSPNWVKIPQVAVRFSCNGVPDKLSATTEMQSIGKGDDEASISTTTSRIKKQRSQGFEIATGQKLKDVDSTATPEDDLTANHWRFRDQMKSANGQSARAPSTTWTDIPLVEFYRATTNQGQWLQSNDRGIMTQALELVAASPQLQNHTTAHWAQIIAMLPNPVLPSTTTGKNLDREAAERFYA